MSDEDINTYLTRRPFEPFSIHVSDGNKYSIRHPDFVTVGPTRVDIGTPRRERTRLVDRVFSIALAHIVRLEPLENQPSIMA